MNTNDIDVNTLMNTANKMLQDKDNTCDSDCQKENEINELRIAYENAEDWAKHGTKKLDDARSAYIRATLSQEGIRTADLSLCNIRLNSYIDSKQIDINHIIKDIETLINNYESVYIYHNNISGMEQNFNNKNSYLDHSMKNKTNDLNKNNRMMYYYSSKIENTEYYTNFLNKIYWFFAICITIWFIYKKKYRIYIILSIFIYPFLIKLILNILKRNL